MFNNDELINIYNDYDGKLYAPSVDPRGYDLIFPQKSKYGEPYVIAVPFAEVKNLYRLNRNLFVKRYLRFEDEGQETEVFKQLNIKLDRIDGTYSREQIEDMIINPSDYVIEQILEIKDIQLINTFLSQLVYLKNTNKYFIASKIEDYIRARKEELELGVRNSELQGQATENVPVVEAEVETGTDEEQVAEDTPKKPGRPPKATNK